MSLLSSHKDSIANLRELLSHAEQEESNEYIGEHKDEDNSLSFNDGFFKREIFDREQNDVLIQQNSSHETYHASNIIAPTNDLFHKEPIESNEFHFSESYDPYAPSFQYENEEVISKCFMFCLPGKNNVENVIQTNENFSDVHNVQEAIEVQPNGYHSRAPSSSHTEVKVNMNGDHSRNEKSIDSTNHEDESENNNEIKLKSILKKHAKQKEGKTDQRRSLFNGVEYETSYGMRIESEGFSKSKKSVHFAQMAKVMTILGLHQVPQHIRDEVWWSRQDYEDFKKTGRIISKAMLEGGSEIWMSVQYGSGNKVNPLNNGDTLQHGQKWWCKFGHSRRGLEHIASIEEGRYRQQNVVSATKAILNEQRRQKVYGIDDPLKLSTVASTHTNFAKELALVAAAADAEAVKVNFKEIKLKPRPDFTSLQTNYARSDNVKALDQYRNVSTRLMKKSIENEVLNKSELAKKAAGFGNNEKDRINIISMKLPT